MKNQIFHRTIIGMDSSYLDKVLLSYLKWIVGFHPSLECYFLQVRESLELPEFAVSVNSPSYEWVPLDEKLENEMMAFTKEVIGDQALDLHFDVQEGNITKELLNWAENKEIDLALLGIKKEPHTSGIHAKRFLRNSSCSVWFVPETPKTQLRKIVIPTDFSNYSDLALRTAINIAKKQDPIPEIEIVHIYDVPTDFQYRLSNTYTQYAEILRENVQDYLDKYLEKFSDEAEGITLHAHLLQNVHFNTARHIKEYVDESDPDLVIMGALGHSALSVFLLGSVTEKFVTINDSLPLLIVRPTKA